MDKSICSVNASLMSLSDEILVIIIRDLKTEDKFVLSKVCSRFDRILLDKRLCRDIEISPNKDGSCLKYLGSYLRNRRQLICTLNVNSCDWIPMQRIKFMTKGLINLHSLCVMNISMPIPVLSQILRQCKQVRELSWSWRGDAKPNDLTWSDIPFECILALSSLVRLHICLPDPWANAVQEFLFNYCCELTHLTVQVDPALGRIPRTKGLVGVKSFGPLKLKSLVAYHVRYGGCIDPKTVLMNDIKLETLIKELWNNSGGLNNKWECFWTNCNSRMSWLHELQCKPEFTLFLSNLKSVTLSSNEFPCIPNELPVTDLTIVGPTLPLLHLIAPKVEKLGFYMSFENSDQIISSICGLNYLVELKLDNVHFCNNIKSITSFWHGIKSLASIRKLSVAPCAIPRIVKLGSSLWNEENFTIFPSTREINKDLHELMKLDHLEVFEIGADIILEKPCQSGNWIPYISIISIWTSLTCLTFDNVVNLRTMAQFKLVTETCINLSYLHFRGIGPNGHCGYVQDVANALPFCHNLKHFSIEQHHISDFLKDLLIGLSRCNQLESVYISNSNCIERSNLKGKHHLQEIILNVINKCPLLRFIRVPIPNLTKNSCRKMKNWISSRLISPDRVNIIMEFCERLTTFEEQYHAYPPDGPRLEHMQWLSKVASTPPRI